MKTIEWERLEISSWRRKWQPTLVFLPGESQERGSLVGCRLWGHTESDTIEATQQQQQRRSLQENQRYRGNIPCKDRHNEGQKWYGPNEAVDIKRRWQEYTEELYKKYLNDLDNHYGQITHREPDILECEVKQALGSITMNKASGGDGIPVELFQILKDDAVKVLHSICQQIWKPQQWPQDWKGSVFIPIAKRQCHRMFILPHNCTHLTRWQSNVNCELLDIQTGFRKGRGTRDQIANICWIIEKTVNSRKISTFASLTMLKPLTMWITTNCGTFFK